MTETPMNAAVPIAGDRAKKNIFRASDRSPEETLEFGFALAEQNNVEAACAAADAAATSFALSDSGQKALLLESIATELSMIGNELADHAIRETGLSADAVLGELATTLDQLRAFAGEVRGGGRQESIIDTSLADGMPRLHGLLRRQRVGIGPVAVLCGSGVLEPFSVAGRDTAAALAAGCPVIVAGDHAYPETRALVARTVKAAVSRRGFHPGSFAFLPGASEGLMTTLVSDHRMKAVAVSGTRHLRASATRVTSTRTLPIPVFAEINSVSPVVIFPAALMRRGVRLAGEFVASLHGGARGSRIQPTMLIAITGPELSEFLREVRRAFERSAAEPMSTPMIDRDHEHMLDALASHPAVQTIARRPMVEGGHVGLGALVYTGGRAYLSDDTLRGDFLGPAGIVVGVRDLTEMVDVLEAIEGQSTAAVMVEPDDFQLAAEILPFVQRRADTILANDWPKENDRVSAVGDPGRLPFETRGYGSSIERFLRPIAYWNFPLGLLPRSLRDDGLRTAEPDVDRGLGEPLEW